VDISVLGEKANATRPEIEQILIRCEKPLDEEPSSASSTSSAAASRRRRCRAGPGLYLASLSCRSIIYKGMMLAEQVATFYPDLQDAASRAPSPSSTSAIPPTPSRSGRWRQPFRMLAHNGEINTLKGNVNWMRSHEIRMSSDAFGEMAEDIKPIIPSGTSDSGALDAVFEVLVRAGRSAPMAKTMMVPEAWSKQTGEMPRPGPTCTPTATRSWSPGTARRRSP
jgi:glutamate synthase (NADPH/NADH) large chain/glutamate synthase (ferredoxin)